MLNVKGQRSKVKGGVGCLVMLILLLCIAVPLGCWTDRNLDFWLTYAKGEPVDVPFIWGFLASLLGPVTCAANVFAEIAKFLV